MKTKRIIVCGLGNVGKSFLSLVAERAQSVRNKYGLNIEVGGVVDLGGAAIARNGALPLNELVNFLKSGGRPENFPGFEQKGLSGVDAITAADYDILVETTPTNLKDGGPAYSFVKAAIGKGMDVVSANKGPFVLYFDELKKLAAANKSRLFISAATGAALPTLDVGNSKRHNKFYPDENACGESLLCRCIERSTSAGNCRNGSDFGCRRLRYAKQAGINC